MKNQSELGIESQSKLSYAVHEIRFVPAEVTLMFTSILFLIDFFLALAKLGLTTSMRH